jgi:hypothetical protein
VALGILSVPGASFSAYYTHLFSEPSWYYEFRSWRGAEFWLLFPGAAGGLVASLLPRRLLILPLFVTAALTLVPILKPWVRPLPLETLEDHWDSGICLQSTGSTCGAASLATILGARGVRVSEKELAREAHSYAGGTEAWYLARAARNRGVEVCFRFASGFDPEIPLPAIAGVRGEAGGHFIAVISRRGDRFRIGDPLIGPEDLTRDQLVARYAFSGFFMTIPNSGRGSRSP